MSALKQKMIEDMQLKGLALRTQEAYINAVFQLSKHLKKSPDQINEEELREYFLYLKNKKRVAENTFSIALCGIKFFYEHTLKKEWHTLQFVRPDRKKKLPVVFSTDEVKRVLDCVHRFEYRVCLNTIYACGLRLLEGTRLGVKDIDSDRKMLHVVGGKRRQRSLCAPARPYLEAVTSSLGHTSKPRMDVSCSKQAGCH